MLDMCCLVLAGLKERLSCRPNPVLRRKIPTSYRTFNTQGDCLEAEFALVLEASFEKVT